MARGRKRMEKKIIMKEGGRPYETIGTVVIDGEKRVYRDGKPVEYVTEKQIADEVKEWLKK